MTRPGRTPAPSPSGWLVAWAALWFALYLLLAAVVVGLGTFTCGLDPEATGCGRQPFVTTTCLGDGALWVVTLVANLTLPVFRFGPNARRRLLLWAPPLLTGGLVLVLKPL